MTYEVVSTKWLDHKSGKPEEESTSMCAGERIRVQWFL